MNERRAREKKKSCEKCIAIDSPIEWCNCCVFSFVYQRENIVKYTTTTTTKIRLPVYYIHLSINCEYNNQNMIGNCTQFRLTVPGWIERTELKLTVTHTHPLWLTYEEPAQNPMFGCVCVCSFPKEKKICEVMMCRICLQIFPHSRGHSVKWQTKPANIKEQ